MSSRAASSVLAYLFLFFSRRYQHLRRSGAWICSSRLNRSSSLRDNPLKIKNKRRIASAKRVDGLVIVPDTAQVLLRAGQHLHDFILHRVNVLKLVN